jgi:hypothetical protein
VFVAFVSADDDKFNLVPERVAEAFQSDSSCVQRIVYIVFGRGCLGGISVTVAWRGFSILSVAVLFVASGAVGDARVGDLSSVSSVRSDRSLDSQRADRSAATVVLEGVTSLRLRF